MAMDAAQSVLAMDAYASKVVVLDLKNKREPLVIDGPPGLMFIKVSRDGNWAATGNWRGRNLAVYDLRSAECVHQISMGLGQVAFSPDSKYLLYSGHRWRKVELGTWDESFLDQERIGLELLAPRFSTSGRFAAFGSHRPNQYALLIDTTTWHPLVRLRSPRAQAVSLDALSPDGSKLVVEVRDQDRMHVDVWDLRQVRNRLAELGLDWNLPAYPEEESHDRSAKRIEWKVDLGELARKQPD